MSETWPFSVAACIGPSFESLLESLAASANELETSNLGLLETAQWPADSLKQLANARILGWVIPAEFGGKGISAQDLLAGYLRLSTACLTTTFILTQRNGACQRIAASDNEPLKRELLPRLARGELFATVGISHLTTSRQHWQIPSVQAEQTSSGFRLTGEVPWVTGATRADILVTGGTLSDGRQILAAVPTNAPRVSVLPPVALLALSASLTGAVKLDGVEISERALLFGPIEKVMQRGAGGGAGALGTSALAAGLSLRAINALEVEAQRRPELSEVAVPFRKEWESLCSELLKAGSSSGIGPAAATCTPEMVRQRANSLVLRVTQAWLAASKGAGYVLGHPAGRAVREALFFLVWSCPQPVVNAALREFTCRGTE